MSVCFFVCLLTYLKGHTSKFSVHVIYGRDSVLWMCWNTVYIMYSSFIDDFMFSHNRVNRQNQLCFVKFASNCQVAAPGTKSVCSDCELLSQKLALQLFVIDMGRSFAKKIKTRNISVTQCLLLFWLRHVCIDNMSVIPAVWMLLVCNCLLPYVLDIKVLITQLSLTTLFICWVL